MQRITLTLPAPYVGLRPFAEAQALLFFGRDAHVRELLAKLERKQRFLAVLGASGSGKSSLVRAGLIPALHRGALHLRQAEQGEPETQIPRWNVCIFTPGDVPLAQLAHALSEDARWVDSADRATAESSLAALLGNSPLALADLYRQKAECFAGEALLLVVDQFEEIFRYRQRNPDEADSFVKLLLRSASEDVPIYIVMTMRSDFLGNAVAFHGLADAINSGIYLTPRLDAEQIRSVITSPLSLVGGDIDRVLANRLVNTLSGEDELPVLQHALLRMWSRARADGRSTIDATDFAVVCAAHHGSGEPMLSFAIDNHASDIHDALTVVIEAFRAQGVGFVLPAAPKPIGPDELIDISHESLIRRWHRFQAWLAEEDLDVVELKEWQQRARRRQEGGGWLDQNDCDRAQRWRTRVNERNERSNAGLWSTRYAGPGAYELVDDYLQASLERLSQVQAAEQALKREAEEARIQRFEVEAQMQREATERAEADKARAEQETAQALAMVADMIRKKWGWRAIVATVVLTMLYIILYEVSVHLTGFIGHQSSLEDEAKSVEVASAAREAVLTPKHSAAAWQLGLRIGYVSQLLGFVKLSDTANMQQAQAALEPMLKEARFFADFLQLDAPVAPMESQTLKEFANISERLESDESGLATLIEQRVSVRHKHLFLLGMHVGVEMCRLDRTGAEQLPLSSIQITRHAPLAGLPRSLWEPLSKAPKGGSLIEVKAAYRAAVAAASKYLTAGVDNESR